VVVVGADSSGGGLGSVGEQATAGRHRWHRFPARDHALKVLYGDDELAAVRQAAALSGLRPSSYVAAAALAMARQVAVDGPDVAAAPGSPERASAALTPAQDRELLAELMRSRVAVRRFGTNLNQAVAALHSGQEVPVWLERAVAGCERAVARLDEAAAAVARRLA
jgi:uncharacterized protein (DUF1778 family)